MQTGSPFIGLGNQHAHLSLSLDEDPIVIQVSCPQLWHHKDATCRLECEWCSKRQLLLPRREVKHEPACSALLDFLLVTYCSD